MPWKTTCQKVQRREFIQVGPRGKTPLRELCEALGIPPQKGPQVAGAFSRTWPVGIDRSIPRGATDFASPECVLAGADPALASAASALGSPQTALGAAPAFWASLTAFERGDRSLAQGLGIDP